MLSEFKQFIMRGNMLDLAVGVIIGAAFGAVVNSLVNDILMPPIGKIVGGVDFSDLFVVLGEGSYPSLQAAKDAGAATLNYGVFITQIINFLLVAAAMFVVIKGANTLQRQPPPPVPTEKDCPRCAMRIPIRATRCPHCTSDV